MDSAWLVPVSLVFGIVVGAGTARLLSIAARRGDRAVSVVSSAVPDGVDQVLDALDSAGIVLDPSNNIMKISPGALALGLVSNQGAMRPELLALADRARRNGGESITQQLELARGPYGEANLQLEVRVAMLGTRYVLILADDRTEAHRLDAVRRDFVANISHELKTPIGAVGLLAEAIQAAAAEPDQVKRFAKRLGKESDRLGRITKELIELSRLQARDAVKQPVLVEIDDVVAAAIDHNRVLADSRSVALISGGDAGAQVYGDEPLLVTAVQNLVANAIHYSSKGSRVGIGVANTHGVVEIAVTDQGIGIADEDRERVFERFYRVDPARSRNTGGSGLGLSIVRHVAENHGGDVRLWSRPGQGSTFTMRLPEALTTVALAERPETEQEQETL